MCLVWLLQIFCSNVKPCYPIKAIYELCLKGERAGVICLTTAEVGKTLPQQERQSPFLHRGIGCALTLAFWGWSIVIQRLNLWGWVGEEWGDRLVSSSTVCLVLVMPGKPSTEVCRTTHHCFLASVHETDIQVPHSHSDPWGRTEDFLGESKKCLGEQRHYH